LFISIKISLGIYNISEIYVYLRLLELSKSYFDFIANSCKLIERFPFIANSCRLIERFPFVFKKEQN